MISAVGNNAAESTVRHEPIDDNGARWYPSTWRYRLLPVKLLLGPGKPIMINAIWNNEIVRHVTLNVASLPSHSRGSRCASPAGTWTSTDAK
jgi:hypothetical protein